MAFESVGANLSTSAGTEVISDSGAAHTKGPWAELTASTGAACKGFYLMLTHSSSVSGQFLVDIGTGAESSESTILANLPFHAGGGGSSMSPVTAMIYVPLKIDAGTRIAARCQYNASVGVTLLVHLALVDQDNDLVLGCDRATTYGANTADSGGVPVDPGAVSNTKSRTELVSATTNDINAFILSMTSQVAGVSAITKFLFDIETGGSGSEVVKIGNLGATQHPSMDTTLPMWYGPFVMDIPAGTRISINMQSDGTSTGRVQEFVLIGFDQQEAGAGSSDGGAHIFDGTVIR